MIAGCVSGKIFHSSFGLSIFRLLLKDLVVLLKLTVSPQTELWEAADLLRADSKVTSQEYCMPVLGLIFLRYAYSRFKYVEGEILKNRPMRGGRVLPVEAADFKTKRAIFLPKEARYDYLLNLPDNADVGQAIDHAMELIEEQSAQLKGVLPKNYTILQNHLLRELLRIFNNSAFNEIKDDIIGRIYEYFLNKFAPAVASDDGVFFTPKSLVRMIVNIIEPSHGTVLDPACGSGGMFVSSADFIEQYGANANTAMTFFGQEKVEYNAKLCIMNMAVHGLNAKIVSGDEANSFYHDAHNLEGSCDYVMANPPFNVDKVKSETAQNAGRLPFGFKFTNVYHFGFSVLLVNALILKNTHQVSCPHILRSNQSSCRRRRHDRRHRMLRNSVCGR